MVRKRQRPSTALKKTANTNGFIYIKVLFQAPSEKVHEKDIQIPSIGSSSDL